jgi:hypothetical protein
MKLPEYFNIWITLKSAAASGAAVIVFLSTIGVKDPTALVAGFVFGLLGGSTQDIANFARNKDAILEYNSKKEEGGQ